MGFIERYFEGESLDHQKKETYFQKIHLRMDTLQRRQWKSRTKRCLKESTEFTVQREKAMTIYHRKDFPLDRLRRVVEDHLVVVKENPSVLVKHSPEVNVSLLKEGESKICVKQFLYPHLWNQWKEQFRPSKGLRSWIAGNGLRARGIPSPKAFAFIEKRNGLGLKESFFLLEAFETGQELDRYLFGGFKEVQRKWLFIKAFSRWLSQLHHKSLYHQDMKACNILVIENGKEWHFEMLDLEDVLLDEPLNERKVFKNFLQLNTSIPKTITRTDRLRFFREYGRLQPMIKYERQFLHRLLKKSRKRGVVYVTSKGVVEEKTC
jgi:hypothetical protein